MFQSLSQFHMTYIYKHQSGINVAKVQQMRYFRSIVSQRETVLRNIRLSLSSASKAKFLPLALLISYYFAEIVLLLKFNV